jgi:DNA repair exonuclease SbcCD ATPase subunit
MIPQRIALRGFLSYRDEQEITLDGTSLWLLSGLNGSGKSAVFDAVTYALFGGHRGGEKNAQALINKDSTSLNVEFDFLLNSQLYQARRTLKLKPKGSPASTQQIRRRQVAEGSGRWEAVPDTSSKAGFDAWVRDNIGLTYETFTSSVLLMQGKAEKLLSAAPKDRFEVLAGIVDLNRYQKLHRRVDDQRRVLQAQAEALQHQLGGMAEIRDEDLLEADRQKGDARLALEEAQAKVEKLRRLELLAEDFAKAKARLAETNRQWDQAQGLLAEARIIELDGQRLQELDAILPRLEALAEQGRRLRQGERRIGQLEQGRTELEQRPTELDQALQQLEDKRRAREKEEEADDKRRDQIDRQSHEHSAALPSLRQLHREREALREAHERARQARAIQRLAAEQRQPLEVEFATLDQAANAAAEVRQQTDRQVTQTGVRTDEARKRMERFLSVVGEKMCRYCGQPLTPLHVQEEKTKLERELAGVEKEFAEARRIQQAAVQKANELLEQRRQVQARLTALGDHQAKARAQGETAERDAGRHAQACRLAFEEFSEPFRVRVHPTLPADWLATTYPTAVDLTALQSEAQALNAESDDLKKKREARRRESQAQQEEWTRLQAERDAAGKLLAAKERELAKERTLQESAQQALADTRTSLPAAWRDAIDEPTIETQVSDWRTERDTLKAHGAVARMEALRETVINLESLRHRKREQEEELERVPGGARTDVSAVGARLQSAQNEQADRENQWLQARQRFLDLQERRKDRQQRQQEYLQAERQHKLYSMLAELLGRNRLQLHLVRRAERRILDFANAVLDRLSGGQLYLRLKGEEKGDEGPDQAFQLEAFNRTAGQKPIAVPFLSGSQRFRVAVSLALAIGQYASRRHRPIESVIIDEGFGCLDRQGRQVMIQELQNLKGQLRCILLVSHQEEFAEAFPDGYHFELVEGTTVARRFSG